MERSERVLTKAGDILDKLFYVFGIAGLLLAVASYGTNIISWWVSSRRFAIADDYALIGLVWASYAGLGILFRSRGHCTIDFVVNLLPEKGRVVMKVVQNVIITAICIIAVYFSWKLSIKSVNKLLTISKVPYFFVDIAIPLGYGHLLLLVVVDTLRSILRLVNWNKKEGA